MSHIYNPIRLKHARVIRKLSLDELAAKLSVEGIPLTKQAISKYENGDVRPSSFVIEGIANALDKPISYFTRGEPFDLGEPEYRIIKSRFSGKDRASILATAGDFFENYLKLESMVGVKSEHLEKLPEKIDVSTTADAELAALKMRRHWKLQDRPIQSVVKLFEEDGIKLLRIPHHEGFDAFVSRPGCELMICFAGIKQPDDTRPDGRRPDLPRMRFNLAHELAHAILNFPPEILEDERRHENLCHAFSGSFLMPSSVLKKRLGGVRRSRINIRELITLKQEYGISLKALAMRMNQCEMLTQSAYRSFSIFYNQRKYGRENNEPGRFIGNEKPQRFDRLLGDALLSDVIDYKSAAKLIEKDVEFVKEKYAVLG